MEKWPVKISIGVTVINDVVDWVEKLYTFHVQDKLWWLGVGYNFSIMFLKDCTNALAEYEALFATTHLFRLI